MTNFLFKQYDRTYKNFDKCMACIEDIVLIAQKQENYEIGKRIEQLLNELETHPIESEGEQCHTKAKK